MGASLLILFGLTVFQTIGLRSNRFRPILNFLFWVFVFNFFFLMWLGGKPAYQPYVL
jgi:ubiquinol-cytochrome c reductase cytochrome b subunit